MGKVFKIKMLKKICFCLLFLQVKIILAQDQQDLKFDDKYFYFTFQSAYYPPHELGTNGSKFSQSFKYPNFQNIEPSLKIPANYWGGIKLISYVGYYKNFKALNNPNSIFFKNNGIDVDLNIGLSPVSISFKSMLSFTPIAFLNLYASNEIGIGWEAFGFKGIGVHIKNGKYSNTIEFYSEIIIGGRLQFDLNAIFQGEWTHIITVIGNDFTYLINPHANKDQLWKYKADDGKNINGMLIKPYALLAYKMPIPLNTIGLLYEGKTQIGKERNTSSWKNKGWGSDIFYHNISIITNFEIVKPLTIGLQLKLSTNPTYTNNTAGLADISKRIATSNSYFYYDSIGISITYKY
ncbi:hypothetical protein [Borreliella tanukii]|uniref:hypothetical protein n=1 Tax=Borreliella tanukii TaxID=56146 RepID=UPI002649225B|nr:hypothetical protein [Borreliella tanukii]WKC79811.1 hypothetical protein QIA28_02585 [Borreliella tanukii]WKC80730.1 hypothetical protein QIA29_02570 [Borreliella tanukii]